MPPKSEIKRSEEDIKRRIAWWSAVCNPRGKSAATSRVLSILAAASLRKVADEEAKMSPSSGWVYIRFSDTVTITQPYSMKDGAGIPREYHQWAIAHVCNLNSHVPMQCDICKCWVSRKDQTAIVGALRVIGNWSFATMICSNPDCSITAHTRFAVIFGDPEETKNVVHTAVYQGAEPGS